MKNQEKVIEAILATDVVQKCERKGYVFEEIGETVWSTIDDARAEIDLDFEGDNEDDDLQDFYDSGVYERVEEYLLGFTTIRKGFTDKIAAMELEIAELKSIINNNKNQ